MSIKPFCEKEEKHSFVEKEKPGKLSLKYKDNYDIKVKKLKKRVN